MGEVTLHLPIYNKQSFVVVVISVVLCQFLTCLSQVLLSVSMPRI